MQFQIISCTVAIAEHLHIFFRKSIEFCLYLLSIICPCSQSVQLDWDNTANEASCPVKRYVIRVKDNSSSRARSWRYDKSTTSVTLNGLRPSTEYNFRLVVDSECTEGKGKAGKWVFIVTPHSSVESGGERVAKSINSHAGRSSSSGNQSAECSILLHTVDVGVRSRKVQRGVIDIE